MPALLLPRKGRYGLVDYEKVFCPDPRVGDVFELRGIDRTGCVVVVRPDQYVANVLPLDAHTALGRFFDGFMQLAPDAEATVGAAPSRRLDVPRDAQGGARA